jgi:hypothetical protein
MHNDSFHIIPLERRINSWFALMLVLSMLGQSLLPTFAFLRLDTNPGLWNEICSSYGARKLIDEQGKQQAPAHHVDCPLCLHIVGDVVLSTASASTALHLIFLSEITLFLNPQQFFSRHIFTSQARGPPAFN